MNSNNYMWVYDWRYRVGFNPKLREEVIKFIDRLPPDEAALQGCVFEWASSFVSIDALLGDLELGEVSEADVLSLDPGLCLHLPGSCATWTQSRLNNQKNRITATAYTRISDLIDAALTATYQPNHKELFSIIFRTPETLLPPDRRKEELPKEPLRKRIGQEEWAGRIANYEKFISRSEFFQKAICRFGFPKFKTIYRVAAGAYAEYWPAAITDSGCNELVVYKSRAISDIDTLDSTLAHEVFPGHGLFYKELARTSPPHFDHGSLCLLEGWATWADWHTIDNDYAKFNRDIRLRTLSTYHEENPDEIERWIARLASCSDSPSSQEQRLVNYFQYPGMLQGYALGALWVERRFDTVDAFALFDLLKGRAWGDYFALWDSTILT